MGIRIHKSIGYGLTDVIADKDNWDLRTDSRFDPDGYMFKDEDTFTLTGFVEYLDKRIKELGEDDHDSFQLRLLKHQIDAGEIKHHSYFPSIIYDMEFGSSEVMLFIPPSSIKNWSRYDDMIDYYDPANHLEDGGITESVIKIDRPLWPWEAYVNIKTYPPVRLTGVQYQLHNTIRNLGFEQLVDPDKSLELMGVDTKEELDELIVPIIPTELVELIKYLKIFKNMEDIYQLRPMIYGYWG